MTGPVASVFVSIVNFRTGQLTVQCLASLAADVSCLGSGRVIVVDNCSEDDSTTQISSAIQGNGWGAWAELLPLPRNGGFAYGNNAAIARARQLDPGLGAVVLLNPDAVVRAGVLARLMEQLNSQPRAGIAGAAIEGPGGELVVSAHVMPSPLGELEASAGFAPLTRLLSRHVVSPPPSSVSRACEWVSRACMMVRREVLDAVGPLDEGFFLYFEEVDFSLRARQEGFRSYYLAATMVYHKGGGSSQQAKAARLFYSLRSRLLYGFKHYSFLDAFALALLTLTIEMAARLLAALGSLSLSKLVETVQGYSALFVCLCTKRLRWRS